MSKMRIKDKKNEAVKNLNKKLKESFATIKDNINNGKLCVVRSLNGIIHCMFDTHPEVMFVAALKDEESSEAHVSVESYVNMGALPENLRGIIRNYIQNRELPENLDELLKEAEEYSKKNMKEKSGCESCETGVPYGTK